MLRRLLPFVPAGVVGGHLLGYRLVGHGHADVVPHDHLPLLALVALPLAVHTAIRWIRHEDDLPTSAHTLSLGAAQGVGFLALEVLERLPVGAPMVEPAVLAGLATQVVVAWAALRVLRVTVIAVERFRPLLRAVCREPLRMHAPRPVRSVRRRLPLDAVRGRSPPAPLVA